MSDLKVGLIGCGRHGERYLRHLARGDVQGMKAALLWRRDADAGRAQAREYGVEFVEDPRQILDGSRVDGVLVLTPPAEHRAALVEALGSGLPALVEKPVIARWEEASAFDGLDASRLMVAQTLRFSPALRRLRQLIPAIGTVHRIRMAQRLEPSDLPWQRDRAMAGGGSVTLTGVHLFDLLRWIVGRTPDSVSCRMHGLLGHPLENLFDASFDYEDLPLLAATEVSKFSRSRMGLLDVVGEQGELHVDYLRGSIDLYQGQDCERVAELGDVPTLPIVMGFFGALIRGEIESPVTLQDGLETVRMAEACYRSHASGCRVRLEEIE
ncbi:hypothetical protein DRQ32_01655 [bacterium]|nr:MAG: hypothetical protein DRQ32_01655 [bacterium]